MLKAGLLIKDIECNIISEGEKVIRVMTTLGNERRVKREDLGELYTKLNNGPTLIGYETWCRPEDVDACKEKVKTKILSHLVSMETSLKVLRAHFEA